MQLDPVLKKIRNLTLILGAVFVVIGIALIASPDKMSNFLGFLLGAIAFILGIYRLVMYFRHQRFESFLATDLFLGVGLSAVGFICLLYHGKLFTYATIIFGLMLIAGGVMKIQIAIILEKLGCDNWWISVIFGLVSLALSLLIIIKPNFIVEIFLILAGVFLLIDGLTAFGSIFMLTSYLKALKEGRTTRKAKPVYGSEEGGGSVFTDGTEKQESAQFTGSPFRDEHGAPAPGYTPYSAVPPAEEKPKKKFSFSSLFKKKEKSEPEITPAPAPQSAPEDTAVPSSGADPFSAAPSSDASMEGVSFDAEPHAASSHTSYTDDSASAYDADGAQESDSSAGYDAYGSSSYDDNYYSEDPMPELTPDPIPEGTDINDLKGANFDPETGEPLH